MNADQSKRLFGRLLCLLGRHDWRTLNGKRVWCAREKRWVR